MSDFSIVVKMQFMDLVRFFKAHEYSDEVSFTVADYLVSCIDYEFDLNYYVWNILPSFVQVFDSKEEAKEYRNENYDKSNWGDCTIYECENNKVYFEGC